MTNPEQVLTQYKDSSNLESRIRLHQRLSTNHSPWMRWVFDHFDFPLPGRILEVGCGTGLLWAENAHRSQPGWRITLLR
jgi:ubiquinone/menaquinone biosynthesis C-methylase UbiE